MMQCIEGRNLSQAWAKAFTRCCQHPGGALSPVSVSFPVNTEKGDIETPSIRERVDHELSSRNLNSIQTVSGTIFPQSLWKIADGSRQKLFDSYEKILPKIKLTRSNTKGIYFQRMIAFPGNGKETVNQLEHVISTWQQGNHRHSALQTAIFDPRTDHNNSRQLGFPCLHQIAFHPEGSNGCDGFSIVAFYANQLAFEKAYGNYLGLYQLGKFMAHEMGLSLTRVTCIASSFKMSKSDNLNKQGAQPIIDHLSQELSDE
jgi:thymidylate synthase